MNLRRVYIGILPVPELQRPQEGSTVGLQSGGHTRRERGMLSGQFFFEALRFTGCILQIRACRHKKYS
jgi:hypothetical protein